MKNNIYKILSDNKMTQAELANKIGMKREYLNRIVNNKVDPKIPSAMRIARELKMPVEKVFIFEENDND